ncbi:MAG: hypothetical protein AB1384_09825 [Actinomycetota bacterium]
MLSSKRRLLVVTYMIFIVLNLFIAGCQTDEDNTSGNVIEPETSDYVWEQADGPPGQMICMSASDSEHVWAAIVVEGLYRYIYFFDGKVWVKQADVALDAMDAISNESVWGVGYGDYNGPGIFHFDGTSWNKQENLSIRADHFTDVTSADEANVWVTYINEEYKGEIQYFDGEEWSGQFVADGWILNICAADSKHVWASGRDEEDNDIIYFFDGKKWTNQGSVDGMYDISDISAADANHVWTTTPTGVFFFDGKTWSQAFQEQTIQIPGLSVEESMVNMSSVCALDASHVWCVGLFYVVSDDPARGAVMRFGIFFFNGETWTRQYESGEQIVDVFAVDDENIWCFGGDLLLFGTKAE